MSMPAFRLVGDGAGHSAAHGFLEFGGVVGFAAILREQKIDYFLRARQASNVGSKNAIGAGFHCGWISIYEGAKGITFEDITQESKTRNWARKIVPDRHNTCGFLYGPTSGS